MNIYEAAVSGFSANLVTIRRGTWPQGKYLKTDQQMEEVICSLPLGAWTPTKDDLIAQNWQVCDAKGKPQIGAPNALKPPTADMFRGGTDDYILQILLDLKLVSCDQIEDAKKALSSPGSGGSLLKALINTGVITKKKIAEALKKYYPGEDPVAMVDIIIEAKKVAEGDQSVDLATTEIPPEIIALVTADQARMYGAIPIRLDGNTVIIALSDPEDRNKFEELRLILNREILFKVATPEQIAAAIEKYYPPEVKVPDLSS